MFNLRTLAVSTGMIAALSACNVLDSTFSSRLCANEQGAFSSCEDKQNTSQDMMQADAKLGHEHFVRLQDYVQQLAILLYQDTQHYNFNGNVAIFPFSYASDKAFTKQTTTTQVARMLSGSLRDLGVKTSFAHVPLALSGAQLDSRFLSIEQIAELRNSQSEYAAFGLIHSENGGTIIQVNMIELNSKRLIASAQKYIPRDMYSFL